MNQLLYCDPATLVIHPVCKLTPELQENDAAFLAIVDSIRENGILHPLIIDPENRILDGRHRWRAAKRLRLDQVPTITVDKSNAATVVLNTLMERRHFTKGALAYVAYPLLKDAWDESVQRKMEALKKGQKSESTQYTTGKIEDFADFLGISRPTLFQAQTLFKSFQEHPELRAEFEPKILSGEVGLGAAIAGIGGRMATKDQARPQAREVQLFLQGLDTVHKRFSYWTKFSEVEKREASIVLRRTVLDMPEELRKEMARALKEAEKNQ